MADQPPLPTTGADRRCNRSNTENSNTSNAPQQPTTMTDGRNTSQQPTQMADRRFNRSNTENSVISNASQHLATIGDRPYQPATMAERRFNRSNTENSVTSNTHHQPTTMADRRYNRSNTGNSTTSDAPRQPITMGERIFNRSGSFSSNIPHQPATAGERLFNRKNSINSNVSVRSMLSNRRETELSRKEEDFAGKAIAEHNAGWMAGDTLTRRAGAALAAAATTTTAKPRGGSSLLAKHLNNTSASTQFSSSSAKASHQHTLSSASGDSNSGKRPKRPQLAAGGLKSYTSSLLHKHISSFKSKVAGPPKPLLLTEGPPKPVEKWPMPPLHEDFVRSDSPPPPAEEMAARMAAGPGDWAHRFAGRELPIFPHYDSDGSVASGLSINTASAGDLTDHDGSEWLSVFEDVGEAGIEQEPNNTKEMLAQLEKSEDTEPDPQWAIVAPGYVWPDEWEDEGCHVDYDSENENSDEDPFEIEDGETPAADAIDAAKAITYEAEVDDDDSDDDEWIGHCIGLNHSEMCPGEEVTAIPIEQEIIWIDGRDPLVGQGKRACIERWVRCGYLWQGIEDDTVQEETQVVAMETDWPELLASSWGGDEKVIQLRQARAAAEKAKMEAQLTTEADEAQEKLNEEASLRQGHKLGMAPPLIPSRRSSMATQDPPPIPACRGSRSNSIASIGPPLLRNPSTTDMGSILPRPASIVEKDVRLHSRESSIAAVDKEIRRLSGNSATSRASRTSSGADMVPTSPLSRTSSTMDVGAVLSRPSSMVDMGHRLSRASSSADIDGRLSRSSSIIVEEDGRLSRTSSTADMGSLFPRRPSLAETGGRLSRSSSIVDTDGLLTRPLSSMGKDGRLFRSSSIVVEEDGRLSRTSSTADMGSLFPRRPSLAETGGRLSRSPSIADTTPPLPRTSSTADMGLLSRPPSVLGMGSRLSRSSSIADAPILDSRRSSLVSIRSTGSASSQKTERALSLSGSDSASLADELRPTLYRTSSIVDLDRTIRGLHRPNIKSSQEPAEPISSMFAQKVPSPTKLDADATPGPRRHTDAAVPTPEEYFGASAAVRRMHRAQTAPGREVRKDVKNDEEETRAEA